MGINPAQTTTNSKLQGAYMIAAFPRGTPNSRPAAPARSSSDQALPFCSSRLDPGPSDSNRSTSAAVCKDVGEKDRLGSEDQKTNDNNDNELH